MDRLEEGAALQGDEADEARVELERGVVGGLFRGRAVIVGGQRWRAPQLIASVRRRQ